MKTITIQVKDKASEMKKAELIDHIEHEMIGALCVIEDDGDNHPTAEEKLDMLQETLSAILRLVQE